MPNPIVARVAAVSAAAVLTAGGVGAALYQHAAAAPSAQTATTTTSTSSSSTTAASTTTRARAKAPQPFKTVLDSLVQQGKISATQEQEILSAYQQYAQTHRRAGVGPAAFGALFRDEQQAIAKALNLTPQQLRADVQSGKSIDAIAAAQKVDPATVQAAAVSATKADLDKAVQAGKLSQAQETKILSALPGRLQKLFAATPNQMTGFGKAFPGPAGRRPAPASSQSTSGGL